MIGSSTTITHGLLVPLCGHEISGWLRGWNNLLTGASAAGEAAGKWVFSPPSRASLLSTAIGSAAPASSSCSSLLRHYYPILRLRPWRAADICRRFIIPSKATTRCCRRSSSFDRLSNNIIPPEMKRVPKKLWDDRLSRALSSVARCGCIVCAATPSTQPHQPEEEVASTRLTNYEMSNFIPDTSTGGRCTPSSQAHQPEEGVHLPQPEEGVQLPPTHQPEEGVQLPPPVRLL